MRNEFSGRYLSTSGSGKAVQYLYNENPHQKWFVFYIGGGLYEFVPDDFTTKRLAVQTYLDWDSQPIWVNELQGYMKNTYFRIIANGDGTYRIQQATSNTRVIDVQDTVNKDGKNGLNYLTRAWNGWAGQRWAFEIDPNYGCGGKYKQENNPNVNCFEYALFLGNKETGISLHGSSNRTEAYINDIIRAVEEHAISCVPIDNYKSPIDADEYRIAVRAPNSNGIYYHVIYQLSNGRWAGKDDQSSSQWFEPGDPSVTGEMWSNNTYPESAGTLYFAVKPKNTP